MLRVEVGKEMGKEETKGQVQSTIHFVLDKISLRQGQAIRKRDAAVNESEDRAAGNSSNM